jgi:hypothetical protein
LVQQNKTNPLPTCLDFSIQGDSAFPGSDRRKGLKVELHRAFRNKVLPSYDAILGE